MCLDYSQSNPLMFEKYEATKIERLKTGGDRTVAGKIVVGPKPARNGRSGVSSNMSCDTI